MSDLADSFGSDKGTIQAYSMLFTARGYGEIYDRYFATIRNHALRILEIGLYSPTAYGGVPTDAPSLRMWREYFPNATCFGFDRSDFSAVTLPHVTILRGDQATRQDLEQAARVCGGGFDIIIDDGSHWSSHQQITLGALFPFLNPTGLYFIEDLSWQPDPVETPWTADALRQWAETGVLWSPYMTAAERAFLEENTASIEIAMPRACEIAVLTRR
jgi:hypothetical protein